MSLLSGAAMLLALAAAGWWPARALAPGLAGDSRVGRASLALALGAALAGLAQLALSAFGAPATPLVPAALAALSLLLVATRTGLRGSPDALASPGASPGALRAASPAASPAAASGRAGGRLPRLLALLLVAVALVGALAAAGLPFRSDGGKFWAPKARELARHGASEAPSLHDDDRLGLHRGYPLLAPALMAPVFALSPPLAVAGPKLLLAALGLAALGLLAGRLAAGGPRALALLAAFATQPLVASLDQREALLATGFVDGLDALFLLLLVWAVERLRADPRPGAILLAALAAAALASTKAEGAVEAAIVLAAWLVAGPRRAGMAAVAGLALLLALPTLVIRAGVAPDPAGFDLARLADGAAMASRLVSVPLALAGLAADATSFGLLPLLLIWWGLVPAPATAPASGQSATLVADRRFARTLLALAAAFLLVSYLASSMHALRHVDTSAHRLLWHWMPVATWLVARRLRLA